MNESAPGVASGDDAGHDAPGHDAPAKHDHLSRIPWWPMWLLGFVTLVDAADGSILRGIVTPLKAYFGVNDFTIGLLNAAPIIVNALITMPCGYLADRWNRMRAIGATVTVWSLFSSASAIAPTFGVLNATRALTGIGQGVNEPSANSVIADYYPLKGRGRAFSVQQCLNYIGIGLGAALAGIIASAIDGPKELHHYYGWRYAYLCVSAPGLIIAYLAFRMREPGRGASDRAHLGVTVEEVHERRRFFEDGLRRFLVDMGQGLWADVKTILRIPTLRLSLVGVATILFTVTGIGFWLPTFYQRSFNVSETQSVVYFAMMLIAGGIPGTLIGGRIADWAVTRIKGARVALPSVLSTFTCTLFLVSMLREPLPVAIALQALGFFTGTAAVPALRAGLSDVTPGTLRGTGFGAFNLTSVIFGTAAAPSIVGAISEAFHDNLRIAFIVVLPPVYIGCYLLFRARRHIEGDTAKIFTAILSAVQAEQERVAERERRAHTQPAPYGDADAGDVDGAILRRPGLAGVPDGDTSGGVDTVGAEHSP